MENKLIALRAERELIQTAYSVKYDELIKGLDLIIDKYFIKPFNAKCIRRWFREEFYPERGVSINFEIGFHNVTEDRIDFGSDMYFTYDSFKQSLETNYGTCGAYSRKDEYQVKRVKTLAYVWDHIEDIESELNNYAIEITPVVLDNYDNLNEIDRKITSIEQELQTQKKNAISESIQVGKVIFYNEQKSLRAAQKLFSGECEVTKVTPKFVVVKNNFDREFRIRKEHIVAHAFNDYITIK